MRQTTTSKLNDVISKKFLRVVKAEVFHKDTCQTDDITDSFMEYLQFLAESGPFMDYVGWHYEQDYRTGKYIVETGRINPDSEILIVVQLFVGDGVSGEDIHERLKIEEE